MSKSSKPQVADDDFVVGSGDYLKDRGYADPGEARAKFFLANQIGVAVEELGVSQAEAANITGLKQPDISRIVNGNVKDYSVWRLISALRALGYDISIEVQRLPSGRGHISARNRSDNSPAITLA